MIFDNLIEDFLKGLEWVLARKDMDSFWPVGFASTVTKYGPSFITDLEESIHNFTPNTNDECTDFPTSLVVIGLAVVYGSFRLDWNFERKRSLLNKVLQIAASQKYGNLLNIEWKNQIISDEEAFFRFRSYSTDLDGNESEKITLCNRLSSLLLAYAEALYFCNHRIATEKHGPYLLAGDSEMLMIRSAKNLRPPLLLWDELNSITELWEKLLPESIELYFISNVYDVKFDMFSNIIHYSDVNLSTNKIGLKIIRSGDTQLLIDYKVAEIRLLVETIESILKATVEVVSKKTKTELEQKFIGILYFSCRGIFAASGFRWSDLWQTAIEKRRWSIESQKIPSPKALMDYWS